MRLSSFKYALNGLRLLLITQANARFHSVFALITIVAGIYFNCSIIEWCLIVLSIGTVLTAEAMNTSLEFLTNLIKFIISFFQKRFAPNYTQIWQVLSEFGRQK